MSIEGESFVILGTSPTASMSLLNSLSSMKLESDVKTPEVKDTQPLSIGNDYSLINSECKTPEPENPNQTISAVNETGDHVSLDFKLTNSTYSLLQGARNEESDVTAASVAQSAVESMQQIGSLNAASSMKKSSSNSGDESLAVSYLLGEVSSDVLKSIVHSQLPSTEIEMSVASIDIKRLEALIMEYQALKSTLNMSFLTMKQTYQTLLKDAEKKKIDDDVYTNKIAKLSNDILDLKTELDNVREKLKICEDERYKEHVQYIKDLSEKTAQIRNMSAHIQKLEEQQLSSFDVIPKFDKTNITAPNAADASEYISTAEHNRIVKILEAQKSALLAENLQIKDMKSHYIDEINCLKVNLVAAEELQRKADADINFLQSTDQERSALFIKFDNERKAQYLEKALLLQQLEVYKKDYKVEHEARENLTQEKEQMIRDLRDLQKRNQELVAEAQRAREEHSQPMMSAPRAYTRDRPVPAACPSTPTCTRLVYSCPLCGLVFQTLSILENHVNECLDSN